MRATLIVLGMTCIVCGWTGCTQSPPNDGGPSGDGSLTLPTLEAPPAFALDGTLVPVPALGGKVLLNEVHYEPADGVSSFVELKGASVADLTAGLFLRNEKGELYAIPAVLAPVDANGIITVLFDGSDQTAGDAVHSAATTFLATESGFVILEDKVGTQLDRVAWGEDRADAVRMHGTGLIAVPSGVGCCRRPQSVALAAMNEWFIASPIDPTPGQPNHNLGARMLFPFDGAIVTIDDVRLDWEFLENAIQFHLQVSTGSDFSSLLVDQMVTDGPVELTLAAGGYYWRVQAMFADGSLADWSPIKRLIIVESLNEDAFLPQDSSTAKSIVALQGAPPRKKLSRPVPMYFQHKDSYMLQVESDGPSGTSHPWDAPHARLDKSDPADRTNCALASISMVNAYFAGTGPGDPPHLTQDRIGYHIHTSPIHPNSTNYPGPEFDLNFNTGNNPAYYQAGLDFALGMAIPSGYRGFSGPQAVFKFLGGYPTEFRDQFWKDLGDSIAADKPVPIAIYNGKDTFDSHAMVARMRLVVDGQRYVQVNDPWEGVMVYPLDTMLIFEYWIIPDGVTPTADEPGYTKPPSKANGNDDDEDGVSNWDEEMRFKTNKNHKDSDFDCVPDLAEIQGSVLNTKHGWGIYQTRKAKGTIQISDGSSRMGKAPEKDAETADSDGGGLNDPMEDLNLNGKFEPEMGETDPFDSADDRPRQVKGFYRSVDDDLEDDSGFVTHTVQEVRTDYDLTLGADGKLHGTVKVKHTFKNTRDFQSFDDECPGPRHDETTWEINYTTMAEGAFVCQGLTVKSLEAHGPYTNYPATFTDSCDGTMATTFSGPINSWGVTNLGTFEERTPSGPRYVHSAPIFPGSTTTVEYDIAVTR